MRIQARLSRVCLLTFALSVLGAAPAIAQVDTGTIRGTVKDESGGVLPGATVTITHEGQGFTLTGVTREDGTYIFTPIRTGAYVVEVEFTGFRTGVRHQRRDSAASGCRFLAAAWRRCRRCGGYRRGTAAGNRHRYDRADADV